MISLLATLVIAQQGTFFARTFPTPTGHNGWEEYLMAADMASGPEASRLFVSAGIKERIAVSRNVVRNYGRVGDLVRAGNKKPLLYPWQVDENLVTNFPEYAALKDVGRVLAAESDVALADGKPAAASKSIQDALVFARRIAGKTTIGAIVSIALQSMAMRSLSMGLPKFGLNDARDLRRAFEKVANERSPSVELYLQEFQKWRKLVPEILASPDSAVQGADEVPAILHNLSTDKIQFYTGVVLQRMTLMEQQARQMYDKEERFWKSPQLSDPDPVVEFVLNIVSPPQVTEALVRNSTQLRLAALHCRLIEFKRGYNTFPSKLSELDAPERIYDRTTGGPYFYAKLSDQSYQLYSLGTPETGRIDLVYRREYVEGEE